MSFLTIDAMEVETIFGQIVAKANHYLSVPGGVDGRRIIKDEKIRVYEQSFREQCRVYRDRKIEGRFILYVRVYHSSERYDLDNSLKTLLDCLQDVGAITNDNKCFKIIAEKAIDRNNPRVQFALQEMNEQKTLF